MLTKSKYQTNFNLILDVPPEKHGVRQNWTLTIIFPMCRKIATSSELLYHYRINPSGISAKAKGKIKTIDSYWITEQLLRDRVELGLENNKTFCKIILNQIRINYSRIHTIGRSDIDRAVFILTSRFWNKYFSKIQDKSPLGTALSKGEFKRYKLLCDLT